MKNCEVVIIVVSVLNSSNFSKKNPGIISGYPETRDKKNLFFFLRKEEKRWRLFSCLSTDSCSRTLRAPSCNAEKKLKIICKKSCKKKFAEILKQSIFASDLQNKHAKPCNCTLRKNTSLKKFKTEEIWFWKKRSKIEKY